MDYMTLKEAAEKWGVTPRSANYYCAGGRIPNVVNLRKYRKFNKKHLTIGKKMQPRYRY